MQPTQSSIERDESARVTEISPNKSKLSDQKAACKSSNMVTLQSISEYGLFAMMHKKQVAGLAPKPQFSQRSMPKKMDQGDADCSVDDHISDESSMQSP